MAKHSSLNTTPDALQPHNTDAEEGLLGSLLIDSDAIMRVAAFIDEKDFFIERNGWIFAAIRDLHEKNTPSDLITLSDELERRGQLMEVGGAAYLTSLINATPTSIHAEYYGRIVESLALPRRLIDAAGKIARMAYEIKNNPDEVYNRSVELVSATQKRNKANELRAIRDVIGGYYDKLEYRMANRDEVTCVPSCLTDLDKLLGGGFNRSDMVIMAGRPGSGKTSLALGIAKDAALRYGKRVAVFSLEMSDEQLVQRLVAAETGITARRQKLGDISPEEEPLLIRAYATLANIPVFIDDTAGLNTYELRTKARRLHAEYGLDLIVIDYLQLMNSEQKRENRQQEISFISRSIKTLARELNIPIIALSQLSRQVESRADKRPMLSDLRESGGLEQDGDVVLFVYRDEMYNEDTEFPNIAEIICAKHRHDSTGKVSLFFKKSTTQFTDLDMTRQSLDY